MRTLLNIPLGGHEEAGRSRVIAATILRAADERQPFCTAVHGDVLVIDGTFPGSVFDPDILARAGVVYAYLYWPSVGNGFVVSSRLGYSGPPLSWSADRFRLLDGTPLALSRTVTPGERPGVADWIDGVRFNVEHRLTWQRITDVIVNAFEAPCGDWVSAIDYANPAVREGVEADSIWYANPIYWHRGNAALIEHDNPDGEGVLSFCLNRDSIARGLAVMAKHCPNQFIDILHENDDAGTADTGTADTFLQCCVFADYVEKHGDVVFG